MNKLLLVELKKIYKKRSIYIIWGLMLIFCLLNNVLYYTDYDEDGNYKYNTKENITEEKINLEKELNKYNKNEKNEVTMYVTLKTKLEILTLKEKFTSTSWQYKKINNYLYDIIYQINYYKFINIDSNQERNYQNQYNLILRNLKNDNYKYFLNIEYSELLNTKKTLKEQYDNELDKQNQQILMTELEDIELKLNVINYRLKNNIKEDNNYLNNALETYQETYKTIKNYENKNPKSQNSELQTYQNTVSDFKISQYIIENKQNINKQNNLNYQLRTIIEDYEILIVMLVLIVSSTIICNEFKDGTIKLLLIKPYSRVKILLSKYFSSMIVLVTTILLLIIIQLIIGGIIFGFSSLEIPVVIYNFNQSKVIEYTIFQYMIIRIIAKIPFLLIMITISFFISILTCNTIISITMPLLLYMFTPTITHLIIQNKLEWLKYLVNINWNLSDYLFGKTSEIACLNPKFSIIILIMYFIILTILSFIIFKHKNIKNI